MELKLIQLAAAIALCLVGGYLVAAPQAVPPDLSTPIVDLHFDIHTKGDDKDKGEAIDFQIFRNDTELVFDSGWFHRDRNFVANSYDDRKGKPKVPLTLADVPKLKLRAEKEGDKGWTVSFCVRANNHMLVLMPETGEVVFGKRNSVNIDEPLLGPNGVKTNHLDGGSIHVFSFAPAL